MMRRLFAMVALFAMVSCTEERPKAKEDSPAPGVETVEMVRGWDSNAPQDRLLKAVLSRNASEFEAAVAAGADPNFVYQTGNGGSITALIVALKNRDPGLFMRLIELGADPYQAYRGIPIKNIVRYTFNRDPNFLSREELAFEQLEKSGSVKSVRGDRP